MKPKVPSDKAASLNDNNSRALSNIDIVTLAIFLLGGDSKYVDTEDVAIKANEIAPGRFAWLKYPDQINIHTVKTHLWDSKSQRRGSLTIGSEKEGWMLTPAGLELAKTRIKKIKTIKTRKIFSAADQQWMRNERLRMLQCVAYKKMQGGEESNVTVEETESFFRLNDYIVGKTRERKIIRILNAFGDDPELGSVAKILAEKIQNR